MCSHWVSCRKYNSQQLLFEAFFDIIGIFCSVQGLNWICLPIPVHYAILLFYYDHSYIVSYLQSPDSVLIDFASKRFFFFQSLKFSHNSHGFHRIFSEIPWNYLHPPVEQEIYTLRFSINFVYRVLNLQNFIKISLHFFQNFFKTFPNNPKKILKISW